MQHLGIDYGTKRIGLAISDETGSLAFPLVVLQNNEVVLDELARIVSERSIGAFVLGESRDLRGQPNTIMPYIERFKTSLEERFGLPVFFEQEFFTSAGAFRVRSRDEALVNREAREMVDAAAAAQILQSFLDRNRKTQ